MIIETNLADSFVSQIKSQGDAGTQWLQSLAELLDYCAVRWSLTVLPPFSNLTYHYVAPVVRADGSDAVLKIGPGPIIHQFGEILNIDKVRIRDWAIAQAVLSVIWEIDYSNTSWTPDLWCAEMLAGIKL